MKSEYKFVENPEFLSLEEIIVRIGSIISYYRGTKSSTHERTKEVWKALNLLINLPESKWDTWIPIIVNQFIPEFGSLEDTEYFKKLLHTLLLKVSNEVKGANPQIKITLIKSIRTSLDSVSKSPYPQICFFVKERHPDHLSDERFKPCEKVI